MTLATARSTDPATSHQAATQIEASGHAQAQRDACLVAVCLKPGQTAAEIAVAAGIDRYAASRRLPELRQELKVHNDGGRRECRIQGTRAMTWWPV